MTQRSPSSKSVSEWLSKEVQPFVDTHIKQSLQSYEYYDLLIYQTKTGGKRLRPGLIMLIGELCELDQQQLQDCAVGVELLHTFSIIHDDLVDGDEVRRNSPSFWATYGSDQAVNIGDMVLAQALKSFPDASTRLAIETTRKMTVGQQLDFALADRRDGTEDEYFEMIERKAGALFNLCLDLPQDLTDTELDIDGYSSLWPAFQIRDDLLDFEIGKGRNAIGNDVREGKRTLMAIHADDEHVYNILDKPRNETTDEDVAAVQRIFTETESFDYARKRMNTCAEEAISSLESLPDCSERQYLIQMAQYIIDRDQ